jgi:hypothetical protein
VADGGGRLPEGAELSRLGYWYRPNSEGRGPNFEAKVELTAPSSKDLTYTVHVVDVEREDDPLTYQAVAGDGKAALSFALVVNASENQRLGVYATSSSNDEVYHRLPAEGFAPVDDDPSRHDYEWYP